VDQRQIWADGDFSKIGVAQVIVGERLARAVDTHTGHRVLDVASGSGNAALAAARRGADVIATDLVGRLLAVAARRAAAEGLHLRTQEADAEQLPFADGEFDVVLSTFGVMFAPDQQRAAAELLRVCRPGGRIGLTAWTPAGLIGSNQQVVARHLPPPPPGAPRPLLWGNPEHVRELLGDRIADIRFRVRDTDLCGASAAERVEFTRTYMGPTKAAFARLDPAAQDKLAADLAADVERFNRATDGTLVAAAEYLEVVADRAR
jgi:SAM-dependent methyltransferase